MWWKLTYGLVKHYPTLNKTKSVISGNDAKQICNIFLDPPPETPLKFVLPPPLLDTDYIFALPSETIDTVSGPS